MYIDEQLTKDMQGWLDTEPANRDLMKGAEMVLKLNRNRILYQNISHNPKKFASKIEYELKKYLTIRLDRKTIQDVVKMDKELVPAVAETLATFQPEINSDDDKPQEATIAKGKRADHDSLPEEIRQLWEDNKDIYFRLKQTFETLKTMKGALPCDRYEYLKQLEELDTKYRDNMNKYDHFDPNAQGTSGDSGETAEDPAEMAKKVSAARGYLSDNKKKLAELKESGDQDKYEKLLAKVQQRYDFLISTGNNVGEEQVNALRELGVKA
jgi:hypothetical protein